LREQKVSAIATSVEQFWWVHRESIKNIPKSVAARSVSAAVRDLLTQAQTAA
jgi:hypothetical protein